MAQPLQDRFDVTWWAPAPLRRAGLGYVIDVHAIDARYRTGRCILCSIPLRRPLSEQGVIETLVEHLPEHQWEWVAERQGFYRRTAEGASS